MRDLAPLWGVDEWRPYFAALNAPVEEVAEEVEFTVVQTGLPLGDLPSTPKRIWRRAGEAGFTMEGNESRVVYADALYKSGEKQGELKKPAFIQRNIFLGGYVPGSTLRFYATWLGGKFSAHIYDPVGRFMYADSQRPDERETYWMEKSSRAFERWLADWSEMLHMAATTKKEAA